MGDDVYVRGLACWFRESYVRGHFNDAGDIVFASGQYVGSDDYGPEYLIGLLVPTNDGDDYTLTDYIFKFDEEERTLTLDVSCIIGESGASNLTDQLYDYIDTAVLTPGKLPLPPTVELPTGVETETWYLSAMQDGDQFTKLMVAQEELKTMPFGEIWDEYCRACGKPADGAWYPQIEEYEKKVLVNRK